jgi:PKD repeat protein
MNLKKTKCVSLLRIALLFAAILHSGKTAYSQCYITASGPQCVNEAIQFNCNSPGSSVHQWDFNSEGNNNLLCNPSFIFTTPGIKTITVSLKMANGQTCNASLNINVRTKPIVKIRLISKKTQCFGNNSFCFMDSSTGAIKGCIYQIDDGVKYTFKGNGPRTVCHSFQDPAGGTYGMNITLEDSFGCITQQRINSVAIVLPTLGLRFTSPQPKRCDSVLLCVTNTSFTPLDSLKSFTWDWGDGQTTNGSKSTPTLWKSQVCHWFKTIGPNSGAFNTKLLATTFGGCSETFTFNTSATNINVQPEVIADFDSVCASNPVVSFALKGGPVPQAGNPVFLFEQPSTPPNMARAWSGSHRFNSTGPYRVSFSFTHSIPGCARTVYDTILVLGPVSRIEGGGSYITDSLRYSCVIKDTLRFNNLSLFYHNDRKMRDDDSTYNDPDGFNKPLGHKFSGAGSMVSTKANPQNRGNSNVFRVWDFDDEYCEKCTTDTKRGVNVNVNCRYSKDSLPKHWYTPWEKIYTEKFGYKPETLFTWNKDSGFYVKRNLWSDDSVAIVRDTILYYGDNPLGLKVRDSAAYTSISKKVKGPKEIKGISQTTFSNRTTLFLQPGDTVWVDNHDGLPPSRWIGQRYLILQSGQTLDIRRKTDKAQYIYSIVYSQDTIPLYLANSSHKIFKKEKVKGFATGDSVSLASHRQRFYSGSKVRCFNVRLFQKDHAHPMACASEAVAALALQPPSARNLRKAGMQCLGGDASNYGMTFILDETKPGCTRTWAEINFDTAQNRNAWVPAIGKNLGQGQISVGDLPPVNFPYGVPIPGYQLNGAAPSRFSTQYDAGMIRDSINGYVHVGLITGNGIWPNGNYPQDCQDTVYYHNFARFPVLDNRFRILKPGTANDYTHICRTDSISLTTMPYNTSNKGDVKTASWKLSSANSGKYYDREYILSVDETYDRFARIHPDSNYLVDRLTIVKRSTFGGKATTLDSQVIRVAKITKWHTEADVSNAFEEMKTALAAYRMDINDFTSTQLAQLIWNEKGTIGKAYTGSRGLVDTSGFGHKISFINIAEQKQTLHYRDTSLMPVGKTRAVNGNLVNGYAFEPKYSGYYIANYELNSGIPGACNASLGQAKKVIVGFYGKMNYTDTILCHGQEVVTSPEFRYFEVEPEINSQLTDPADYWRTRIGEAGNPEREGYTRTDLSKADDDVSKPLTIFGGFPYNITGMDNKPNKILQLGGLTNGLYYYQDSGLSYIIRTATSDSLGCRDTFTQEIFTTAARANFRIDHPQTMCRNIVYFFDSSYVIDPHLSKYGTASDKIIKWTIYWGDNSANSVNSFFDVLPSNIAHLYEYKGKMTIKLRVETMLGCVTWDSFEFANDGPIPMFDTSSIKHKYCIGEKISFKNLTTSYYKIYNSLWRWQFGDGTYMNQWDTLTSANDTISHRYTTAGKYNVTLSIGFKYKPGVTQYLCTYDFPDTVNQRMKLFQIEIIDCDTTAIEDYAVIRDVKMYPNPAHNILTIVSKEKIEVMIIDAMGKTIRTFINEGEQTVDLRNLSPGLYIVTTRNRQVIGKLIME